MIWIGLTGGIACGKSTVSNLFKGLGVSVLSADDLSHQALGLAESIAEITKIFNSSVLTKQGDVDRKKLGQIVFTDPLKLRKLEDIIHPIVKKNVCKWKEEREAEGKKLAIYDVPLLFEKKMQQEFDGIIVVSCKPELQIERLIRRDHLSEKEAQIRIKAQLPIEEKIQQADWSIENSGSEQDLLVKVQEVLKLLNLR